MFDDSRRKIAHGCELMIISFGAGAAGYCSYGTAMDSTVRHEGFSQNSRRFAIIYRCECRVFNLARDVPGDVIGVPYFLSCLGHVCQRVEGTAPYLFPATSP